MMIIIVVVAVAVFVLLVPMSFMCELHLYVVAVYNLGDGAV